MAEQIKKQGKFHALTPEQKITMSSYGFLPKEIKEFDNSLATDFGSKHFQNMLRSRRLWVSALQANGWKTKDIYNKIQGYYRKKKKRSPWDFFRMEYAQVSQRPVLSSSRFANFLDIRNDVSRNLGRAYGRVQATKKSSYKGLKGLPKRKV